MISQHNAINFWQSIRRVMVALFAVSILFGTLGAAPAKDAKKGSKTANSTATSSSGGGRIALKTAGGKLAQRISKADSSAVNLDLVARM